MLGVDEHVSYWGSVLAGTFVLVSVASVGYLAWLIFTMVNFKETLMQTHQVLYITVFLIYGSIVLFFIGEKSIMWWKAFMGLE